MWQHILQCISRWNISDTKTNFKHEVTSKLRSSGIWRRVVLVRRTGDSEEHVASIFRVTGLWVFPACSEDMPHDGRRREPLATSPPRSCISDTAELLLMCQYPTFLPSWKIYQKTAAFDSTWGYMILEFALSKSKFVDGQNDCVFRTGVTVSEL
jgi:hypothetical protein